MRTAPQHLSLHLKVAVRILLVFLLLYIHEYKIGEPLFSHILFATWISLNILDNMFVVIHPPLPTTVSYPIESTPFVLNDSIYHHNFE